MIVQISSTCPLCGLTFETDLPELPSTHGGGFYPDLQPDFSSPINAIWETLLFSCPECGYTTYGPYSAQDRPIAPGMAEFVRTSLSAFARRQQPSIKGQPGLTSKFELYALQLDFQGAEDHLIADQFLRASWSARIRNRAEDARRLRSLAAARYEKALPSTAKQVVEDEIIALYLLVELYRLLGEEGRRMQKLEKLIGLTGESIMGEALIEVAQLQLEETHENTMIRGRAGVMNFVGAYRGLALTSHGYVALKDGDLQRAAELFKRVLGFCEGPLRTRIRLHYDSGEDQHGGLLAQDLFMKIDSTLDKYGMDAAVGLCEVERRRGTQQSEDSFYLEKLVRLAELKWGVSASELCQQNVAHADLPPKTGWRHIRRSTIDPEPIAYAVQLKNKDLGKSVESLVVKALEDCAKGQYDAAGVLAKQAIDLSSEEIKGLDSGIAEYFEFARLRTTAHTVEAMSLLVSASEVDTTIHYIEKALQEYHAIGGPKTNAKFAFLLSLLACACERKGDNKTAEEARNKAWHIVDSDPAAVFHWGRQLSVFLPTNAYAPTVLMQALEAGTKAKNWVEGASALELARIFAPQTVEEAKSRTWIQKLATRFLSPSADSHKDTRDGEELLKRAVLTNYIHAPRLWSYELIESYYPNLLKWAESFSKSRTGQDQLRPQWRNVKTEGDFNCAGCNRHLPYTASNLMLVINADDIHGWLEIEDPIGLSCEKCGIFGACCWDWHTFDVWSLTDAPTYVPLCPRCGNVLKGA
jgi:hypothetical protein